MRYSSTHKQETRERLIEAAGAQAKTAGFSTSGVDALMALIGLTGGAFYSHFESKPELFNAIVQAELEKTRASLQAVQQEGPAESLLRVIEKYLGEQHLDNPAAGCALPALAPEIARADVDVRRTAQAGIESIHAALLTCVGGEKEAWALLSMSVGAIALARAVEARSAKRLILSSVASVAKTLPSAAKPPKRKRTSGSKPER